MVHDDDDSDKEWVPPYKKGKYCSEEGRKWKEESHYRLAKIQTLEKIEQLRREENISLETPRKNKPKLPEKYHQRSKSIIPNKFMSKNYVIKGGKMVVNKLVNKFLQKGKSGGHTKKLYRKRKRIKPRLSVTIPESKLLPKKKRLKFRSKINKEQNPSLKTINDKNEPRLNEVNGKIISKIKEYNCKENFEFSNSQQCIKSNDYDKTLHSQVKFSIGKTSKDNKDINFAKDGPHPLCYQIDNKEKLDGKLVLKLKRMSRSRNEDNEYLNVKEKSNFNNRNQNVEIIINNTSKDSDNANNTSDEVKRLKPAKESDIFAHNCFKDQCTDQHKKDIREIQNDYISAFKGYTLKFHKMIELSFNPSNTEINETEIVTKACDFEKNWKTQIAILSTPTYDRQEKDKSNKNLTSFDETSSSENILQKLIISGVHNEDPYEQLFEDFTRFYSQVFDVTTNEWCSMMGDLLQYIVANEKALFHRPPVSQYENFKSFFSTNCQEKIRNLNFLFVKVYGKIIYCVTKSIKQRKILLIACFLKLRDRISKISTRPWTLKETRLNLVSYLDQETLILPLVGEMFFKQEEAFLQDCMMVVDFTLKNPSVTQDDGCDQTTSISVSHNNQPVPDISGSAESSYKPTNIQNSTSTTSENFNISENSEEQVDLCNNISSILKKGDDQQQGNNQRFPSEGMKEGNSKYGENIRKMSKNYKIIHNLLEIIKRSPINDVEEIVDRLRIGDIDLNIASHKLKEILKHSYSMHDKINDLVKGFLEC